MVLGIGRSNKLSREIDDALNFGGGSKSFNGYATTLVTSDFSGFSSDFSPTTSEWVNLAYYSVGDQEAMRIGSKDSESGETGKVNIKVRDTSDSTLGSVKVRVGYETKAGRSTDPVFEYPASRLDQSDVEDQVQLAPQKWGRSPPGRNGSAQAQDRIFVDVYSSSSVTIDNGNTVLEVPVTKQQD